MFEVFTPVESHLQPTSSLNPNRWRKLLQHYPDSQFPELLAGIATYGARAGYEGPLLRIRGPNHSSAFRISDEISANIQAEVSAGRVLEISSLPQFYVISPLGAVEKRANGTRTGWRRIHDLSFPKGASVNDGIPAHYGTLLYQTLDDAIRLIGHHGRHTVLRKRDLKDAFRMIPLSPLDYWLFLFEWKGKLYVDIFLPFGLRTSPFIFNLFSEGLHWILEWLFDRPLVHYLDDFLLINDPDPEFFGQISSYLGLFEKTGKREDGWVVNFLGIELDSDAMEARLPQDKRERALAGVQNLLVKGSVSHHSLEKLLGFLSFCSRVVPLGRPFLRNLFNLLRKLSQLHPQALRRLSAPARRDLQWWVAFLPHWSGIRLINPMRKVIKVYTDASGAKGIGGWFRQSAFTTRLPRQYRSKHIDWKEAYALLFALAKWGSSWYGHTVIAMCDNSVIVSALNSKSVKGEAIHPLQLIFLTAALNDIDLLSEWLSTKENWIADALSRFQIDKVTNLFPQFQDPSFQLRRETGKPMSELRAKLQTFFGTDSLPELEPDTLSQSTSSNNLLLNPESRHSPHPSHFSRTGTPTQSRKHRRRPPKATSLHYAAIMSTSDFPQQSLTTRDLNGSSVGQNGSTVRRQFGTEKRSPKRSWFP